MRRCEEKIIPTLCYIWLLLIGCIFADDNEVWEFTQEEETCNYQRYEAAKDITIDGIPTNEAQVPTTILMTMFGKTKSKNLKNMDLGANLWMHFRNLLNAVDDIKAPVLGPFLGCMGVGFGALNRELNTITPEQLIESTNNVIRKITAGVNRQFENIEAMFHHEFNKMNAETLRDIYDGKIRRWRDCAMIDKSDECQQRVAEAMVDKQFFFMFQQWFEHDKDHPNDQIELSDNQVKILETQLPLLKIWAELHISVYAVLVKRFENATTSSDYNFFYRQMNTYGEKYTTYMEWAVQKIKTNRYLNQNNFQKFDCASLIKNVSIYAGLYDCSMRGTCNKLDRLEQSCNYKCSSMSTEYCNQTATLTCNNGCYLSFGLYYSETAKKKVKGYELRMVTKHENKAYETCKTYRDSLKPDVDNYWYKTIEFMFPNIKAILNNPGSAKIPDEDGINARQDVAQNDDGSGTEISEEEKQLEAMELKFQMEDKAIEEKAMQGITSTTTMSEYFAKLIENTSEGRKKRKKELKKQKKNEAKIMKKKKIGQ